MITQAENAAKEADEAREQMRAVESRSAVNERLSALDQRSQEPDYPASLPGTRQQHERAKKDEEIAESFDENGFRWEKIESRLHQRTLTSAPSINYRNRLIKAERLRRQDRSKLDNKRLMRSFMNYGQYGLPSFLNRGEEGREDLRAFQIDIDTSGGYLRPPDQIAMDVVQEIDDMVYIHQEAKVHQLKVGERLRVNVRNNRQGDAKWTSELEKLTEEQVAPYGEYTWDPHRLTKLLMVSNDLWMMDSDIFMEEFSTEAKYAFDVTLEKAFLNGTGAGQPQGVLTPGPEGGPIASDRRISEGNTTTAMTYDGAVAHKFDLKKEHRKRAKYMFHRDACMRLYRIKDNDGRPLYYNALADGETDMFNGLPVMESEYAPNVFTTGLPVGILANWMHYRIAESLTFETKLLDQPWAVQNQTGFIIRWYVDAKPDLGEAFSIWQLA